MKSMTGYAYNEVSSEQISFSVEIKSYNSRYLDLEVYLPPYLSRIENHFRRLAEEKIRRGKVEISIKIKQLQQNMSVAVDLNAAKAYRDALSLLAQGASMCPQFSGKTAGFLWSAFRGGRREIPLELIAAQEGVLTVQNELDIDFFTKTLTPPFLSVLQAFIADRDREGANIAADIRSQLAMLEKAQRFFADWQPKMDELFRESIRKRFAETLGTAVDEARVLTETAALLVKYTINEEIIRLESHLRALKAELASDDMPGRKIDFICQEINREINTIGSKNQFVEVGEMVIAAKNALENIREQARNIE
jgi:uncharacterized protein (TIGR00255 family)